VALWNLVPGFRVAWQGGFRELAGVSLDVWTRHSALQTLEVAMTYRVSALRLRHNSAKTDSSLTIS
jgi:hypothetical protein